MPELGHYTYTEASYALILSNFENYAYTTRSNPEQQRIRLITPKPKQEYALLWST